MALTAAGGLSTAQKDRLQQFDPTMDPVNAIPASIAHKDDVDNVIADLASTASGKGASCIGYEGGTTVQAQVAANTASIAALGGGGNTGFDAETAGAGGKMELYEATANGTNKVTMASPASLAADRTITVPDADVTLADIATNTAAIAAATTDTGVGAGNAGKLVELDGDGKLDGRNIGDDGTKLDGIEALADVTDLANVTTALGVTAAAAVNTSAGAGDDGKLAKLDASGLWNLNMIPVIDDTVHGSRSGGALHADAVAGVSSGFISAASQTKLDGIETAADVTDLANVTTALSVTAATAVATSAGAGDAGKLAKLDAGGKWDSTMIPATAPAAHAASHTDGSDDIQDATPAQKGLMTSTYASEVTANTAALAASAATSIGIVRHILVEIANGGTRDIDTALPPGTWEPVNAWVVNEEASIAADSIQLVAVGVGAITEDMSSLAADQAVLRPATFNRTQLVGGTNALRCAITAAAGAAPAQTAHFLLRQVA